MKIKSLTAILAASALAGGVLILSGDEQTSVDASTIRVAKLAVEPEDIKATCPGGITKVSDGYLCLTDSKDSLTDEQATGTGWLAICERTDEETKVAHKEVLTGSGVVPGGCAVIAKDLLFTHAQAGVETDLTKKLQEVCTPCPVTPTSWGSCPYCLSGPGGCAAACPAAKE